MQDNTQEEIEPVMRYNFEDSQKLVIRVGS